MAVARRFWCLAGQAEQSSFGRLLRGRPEAVVTAPAQVDCHRREDLILARANGVVAPGERWRGEPCPNMAMV